MNSPHRIFVSGPVSWNQVIQLAELPEPRPHMVFAGGHRETVGGTSAGKALNLRDLGAEVALRTLVGDDDHADRVLNVLRSAGVRVFAETGWGGTERHLNLMDSHGGRVSIYLQVPTPAVPAAAATGTLTAVLAASEVAVIDLAEHSRALLPLVVERGLPIWCDLHDYRLDDRDGRSEFHQDFIAAADVLFLNDDGLPDAEPFMLERIAEGARLVVQTRGAAGARAIDAAGRWHEVAAEPIDRIVDTNGAGDAFFAGFLLAHLDGADVADALAAGARQAARTLASPDLAPASSR